MADKWNEVTGVAVTYTEWIRCWRTNLESPLGQPPVLTAWVETVRTYSDGKVEHINWPNPIIIAMTELTDQDLLDALTVREKLTSLIGKKIDAVLNPPAPEPQPETPPEETTLGTGI